jgi:hypothetical protein
MKRDNSSARLTAISGTVFLHGSLGTKMGDSLLAYALPAADVQRSTKP